MANIAARVRSAFSTPVVAENLLKIVGGRNARRDLAERYLKPRPGDRVLDIGCGCGALLDQLCAVDYFGYDLNAQRVRYAHFQRGRRGHFNTLATFSAEALDLMPRFDLVVAQGALARLNDPEALEFLRTVKELLTPRGRFVAAEPGFAGGQSRASAFFVRRKGDDHLRDDAGYGQLAFQAFGNARVHVRHDRLRVPFTYIIIEADN